MILIDADEIKKREHDVVLANGAKHRCFDTTTLFEIPTADAVEVVRCKDCKHCLIHDKILFCGYMGSIGEWRYRTETDYCSRGERRDEVKE